MDAELRLEVIGIKRFKRFGVYIVQLDWIAFECLRNRKNISICREFGRNRPIKSINGSDVAVHREPLSLSPLRWIADGRSRWSHVNARLKTSWNHRCWITIWRLQCVSSQFNLDHYNSRNQWSRLNQSSEPRFKPRVHLILSENKGHDSHARLDVPYAATSPPYCDRWSWSIGRLWWKHVTCAL